MTAENYLQIALFLGVLLALVKPLGWYMARVYQGQPIFLDRALGPLERGIYRLSGVNPAQEMTWKTYAVALLLVNALGLLTVYLLLRIQGGLALNPEDFGSIEPDTALNIAISFASNTNWQNYGGETTLSYLSQMLGLTVQNFLSAATGMAVLVALTRGLARRSARTVGNFWVDLTRSTLYILLPLSLLLSVALVSQGVVQNLNAYEAAEFLQPATDTDGESVTEQRLAMGPAASQVAIKQLGTNGGGFFNANSAHPFENATPISNFLEMLALLIIPAGLTYTFGKMIGDTRQGWAILAAMTVVFMAFLILTIGAEQDGNPRIADLGVDISASAEQPGGNMEGKELRFGISNSALWATATTAASNGSVNSMHDSFMPLGGLGPMVLMQLGEVIFGGVGSGLYGMLIFAIIAVFIAGLMVGRTPEYLGKKIESFEVKMAAIAILVPPAAVLIGTAIAVTTNTGVSAMQDAGPHGFSEALYAFTSQANNNGSAFAGYSANTQLVNITGGLAMLFARYWIVIPVLAIAGSVAAKKTVPIGPGTLPTHTPLFTGLLIGVVLIVGALTFIPALALGSIVEQLLLS